VTPARATVREPQPQDVSPDLVAQSHKVRFAVRVGVGYVRSVGAEEADALVAERERGGPFVGVGDLARRAPLDHTALEALVVSGACDGLQPSAAAPRIDRARPAGGAGKRRLGGASRRELLWELGLAPRPTAVPGSGGAERQLALPIEPTAETPDLPEQTVWERMLADYRTTDLSVGVHPLELLRPHLPAEVVPSSELPEYPDGRQIAVAGLAVARQRPSTANGIVFMLLEDELGQVNLIVPPPVYERYRAIVRAEPLILARGVFERRDRNVNVLVRQVASLGPLARRIANEADVFGALPAAHHFGHR
jgi:error-prone DNA polymerase